MSDCSSDEYEIFTFPSLVIPFITVKNDCRTG